MERRESHFESLLQLLGRICPAMFTLARIWPGVPRHWRFPPVSGAIPPGLYPLGLGLLPGAWGTSNKGNANGAESIFGNAGHVWATDLRPDPP